jgi:hypothetical protein
LSAKDKIETQIAEWENPRLQIISLNLTNTFENDVIFVNELLRAEHKRASTFCDTWKNQLEAVEKLVDFFKITKAYKIVVNKKNQSFSSFRFVNAAILQDVTQNQSTKAESFNQSDQNEQFDQEEQFNKSKDKDNNQTSKRKSEKFNERCIYRNMHTFKKCSYIVSFNKKLKWKKNKSIRNHMKKKIKKRLMIYKVISKIINTNILNKFSEEQFKNWEVKAFHRLMKHQNQKKALFFDLKTWLCLVRKIYTRFIRILFMTRDVAILSFIIEIDSWMR